MVERKGLGLDRATRRRTARMAGEAFVLFVEGRRAALLVDDGSLSIVTATGVQTWPWPELERVAVEPPVLLLLPRGEVTETRYLLAQVRTAAALRAAIARAGGPVAGEDHEDPGPGGGALAGLVVLGALLRRSRAAARATTGGSRRRRRCRP